MYNIDHQATATPTGTNAAVEPRDADHDLPTVSPLPLMRLSIGFWSSKALATACELDLFARLSDTDGRTVDELAELLGVGQRPVEMLVTACVSLGLLERREGRYVNSALAEESSWCPARLTTSAAGCACSTTGSTRRGAG